MKSYKKIVLMIIPLLLICTSCSYFKKEKPLPYNQDLIKESENLAITLKNKQYDNVYQKFNENLKSNLTTDELAETWESILQLTGEVETIDRVEFSEDSYDIVIVTVLCRDMDLTIQFSFDDQENIDGLWFKPQNKTSELVSNDQFEEIAIKIKSESYELSGILTVPKQASQHVVLFVHGSGALDMNETIGHPNNQVFRDLAHGLAEQGITSIRYNKRTYQSTNNEDFTQVTIEDEVFTDVTAAIAFIQQRSETKDLDIVIVGHSLGGMLAPIIAKEHKEVSAIVSLAGTPYSLIEVLERQLLDAGTVDKNILQAEISKANALTADSPVETILGVPSTYWYSLSTYDQATVAQELDLPMLFLQGEADCQIKFDIDYSQWQKLLENKSNVTFKHYPLLNHLFMKTDGFSDGSEYYIENTVDQEVIKDIATWINQLK